MFRSDFESHPPEEASVPDRLFWGQLRELLAGEASLTPVEGWNAWGNLARGVLRARRPTPAFLLRVGAELYQRESYAWARRLLLRVAREPDTPPLLRARAFSRLSRVAGNPSSLRFAAAAWRMSRLPGMSQDEDLLKSVLNNGTWVGYGLKVVDAPRAIRIFRALAGLDPAGRLAARVLCNAAAVSIESEPDLAKTLANFAEAMHAVQEALRAGNDPTELHFTAVINVSNAARFLQHKGFERTAIRVLKQGLQLIETHIPQASRWRASFQIALRQADPFLRVGEPAALPDRWRSEESSEDIQTALLPSSRGDGAPWVTETFRLYHAPVSYRDWNLVDGGRSSSKKGGADEWALTGLSFPEAVAVCERLAHVLRQPVRLPKRSEIEAAWRGNPLPAGLALAPWPEAYRPLMETLRPGLRAGLDDLPLPGLEQHPFRTLDIVYEYALPDDPAGPPWIYGLAPSADGRLELVWLASEDWPRGSARHGPAANVGFRLCCPRTG